MVSRYFVYKQALLEEAERLVQAHVLREKDDIFYLTFQELHDVVRTNQVDDQLILQRKTRSGRIEALTPPRVLTSDGEVITGRTDATTATRRARRSAGLRRDRRGAGRVILDMAEADSKRATSWSRPPRTQLVATVRRDQRPGDGGRGPDDPRRGDRAGVRLAGRRGGGAGHAVDPGRSAHPS
jgi:hypothetical protein